MSTLVPILSASGVNGLPRFFPMFLLYTQKNCLQALPGGGFRHVRGLLQLLLAYPETGQERKEATHSRHNGQANRPSLGV